jgi:hypothetical protein
MKGECIMKNIATSMQPNSNLIELNDEELEVVSGGLVGALIGALGVTTDIAIEGLLNPASRARDILINQIVRGGAGAVIGVGAAAAAAILAGGPLTVTAAALSDS